MMVLTPLNEEKYDIAAVRITYLKLFEHLMEDFVTRKDAEEMMSSKNLPVSTTVNTAVNTAVTVPQGAGTGIGKGTGSGAGKTIPIYTGSFPSPKSNILKQQLKAEQEGKAVAVKALIGSL